MAVVLVFFATSNIWLTAVYNLLSIVLHYQFITFLTCSSKLWFSHSSCRNLSMGSITIISCDIFLSSLSLPFSPAMSSTNTVWPAAPSPSPRFCCMNALLVETAAPSIWPLIDEPKALVGAVKMYIRQ